MPPDGSGPVVEAYPDAALRCWLPSLFVGAIQSYKGSSGPSYERRELILAALLLGYSLSEDASRCRADDLSAPSLNAEIGLINGLLNEIDCVHAMAVLIRGRDLKADSAQHSERRAPFACAAGPPPRCPHPPRCRVNSIAPTDPTKASAAPILGEVVERRACRGSVDCGVDQFHIPLDLIPVLSRCEPKCLAQS